MLSAIGCTILYRGAADLIRSLVQDVFRYSGRSVVFCFSCKVYSVELETVLAVGFDEVK